MNKYKVSKEALQSIVQRNLYSRSGNYELENEELCRMAQQKYGYRTGVWVTEPQILNMNEKYPWSGIKVLNGEKPHVIVSQINHDYIKYITRHGIDGKRFEPGHVITKEDIRAMDDRPKITPYGETIEKYYRAPVYNIDQTNFAIVAPGAYDLMLQGKTFMEVCNTLMHQPLVVAQQEPIVQTKPSLMQRIAAMF